MMVTVTDAARFEQRWQQRHNKDGKDNSSFLEYGWANQGQSTTTTQQQWQTQQFLSWNMEGPTWANWKTEMALPDWTFLPGNFKVTTPTSVIMHGLLMKRQLRPWSCGWVAVPVSSIPW
jgi:hypothetical protein